MPRLKRLTRNELNRHYGETTRRAVALVKREYPNLVGLLVHGSVARREPGPFSDIDLSAITSGGKKPSEFSYFDGDIYVGVGFLRVAELEREFSDPEAFFWARGSAKATRVFHDPKKILKRILGRWRLAEPSRQILEKSLWDAYHNIIEYSGKLRNGWVDQDEYNTRHAARVIGQYVERAIITLNEISIVSENYLWHHVLKAKKRPRHLAMDYPVALGIRGTKQTAEVYQSAMRLCGETLRLIRNNFRKKARHKRFRALLAEPLEKHGL
ncbi:MAG TPA: nucleotidyltransferase domain-containing protein [Candidatus Bathyarchaeia archaeon]|nr:nucleotidyltransferase domain-containing protein [Candidatus Bathyarchaeia archaeon]